MNRAMTHLWQKALRSTLVWRYSGVTYPTAVLATSGRLLSRSDYLAACQHQMDALRPFWFHRSRVLEFGSGLGGNLLSIAPYVGCGVGLDVNRWFTRLAKSLQRSTAATNLQFVS